MKRMKAVCLSVLVIMAVFMLAVPAAAATKNYTLGKKVELEAQVLYRFKAPETGFVTLVLYDTKRAYGSMLDSAKEDVQCFVYCPGMDGDNGKGYSECYGNKFAVQKGSTYYLRFDSYSTGKFKLLATKYSPGTNYCMLKAKSVVSGHKVYSVDTPRNSFGRWYRFKTTTAKQISVNFISDCENLGKCYICRSNGKVISATTTHYGTASSLKRVRTASKVSAGTYYIYFEASDWNSNDHNRLAHFYIS